MRVLEQVHEASSFSADVVQPTGPPTAHGRFTRDRRTHTTPARSKSVLLPAFVPRGLVPCPGITTTFHHI